MGLTVYAENMGLFHKGSGGKAVAPADVCLSPPPPPGVPAPVPYVNNVAAGDLSKGSKTVKVDGEETALEGDSEVSTSTGDEGGTQGGNLITHKTKGKASFTLWSFTVKVEGKGVGRHGDPMGQNGASTPFGVYDLAAITAFMNANPNALDACTKPYPRPRPSAWGPTPAQQANLQANPQPCWRAPCTATATVPDHQPPLRAAWALGGCNVSDPPPTPDAFTQWASSQAAVPRGHCLKHSCMQGGHMGSAGPKLEAVKAILRGLIAMVA